MSKYKEIKGFKVQTLASDTSANKYAGGAWTSGGNLPQVLYENAGAGATQTAALNFGGQGNPPGPAHPTSAETQTYDGSSWTEVNDLNNSRRLLGGAGTYTSAIAMGGYTQPPGSDGTQFHVELWDGTNWTETTNLNTKGRYFQGFGVLNTAAVVANRNNGSSVTNKTETWNGSAWTEVAESNTNRSRYGAAGTSTAGVIAGGSTPAPSDTSTAVEQWNGSAWTEIAEINTGRNSLGGSGAYTDALMSGGTPPATGKTERYDGSSWTELSDLSTGRYLTGSAGHTAADTGIVFGGEGRTASTEEFSAPAIFTKTNLGQVYFNSGSNAFKVTAQPAAGGSWSSGGDLNTARSRFGGAGQATQSAALVFGAGDSPYGQTEEYNGTAWSEQNDLNTGRNISPGGAGTQTAALTAGGYNPAGSPQYNTVNSETYNGTSWTEGNDLNEGRIDCVTFGSSTAGILVGGGEASGGPGTVASVEIYNGTSWTETTDIPTVTQEMAGWGVQTSGAIVGGSVDSDPTMKNTTVEWDGTSWSAGGNYSRNNKYFQAFGTSVSSGLAAGGENPGESPARLSIAAVYDGTSWSEVAELSSARHGTAGGGTTTSGLISGGTTAPTTVASTEEWTVPEANKTITVS